VFARDFLERRMSRVARRPERLLDEHVLAVREQVIEQPAFGSSGVQTSAAS
jgi:hypothetical protein